METRKLQRIALVTGASGLGLAGAIGRQMQAEPLLTLAPATQSNPRPADIPAEPLSWRQNEKRMADAKAASPLPTRQLKRMAARDLARELSKAQKLHARHDRLMAHKRGRALAAALKHAVDNGDSIHGGGLVDMGH